MTVMPSPGRSACDGEPPGLGPANRLTGDLQPQQFARISRLMHHISGVVLKPGKEEFVKARLLKRVRALQMDSFDAYLAFVEAEPTGQELITLIDMLTTNKTSFFREPQHFAFLRQRLVPQWGQSRQPLRFWSAGCSSGEEPYSLAITLRESLPRIESRNLRILATDISGRMLALARRGIYDPQTLEGVSPTLVQTYFTPTQDAGRWGYRLAPAIQDMVQLARLNLMQAWPMHGPFDVIFCRNVMIYFDKPTQAWLVQRFWKLLRPGGHLFIGHSESLSGAPHGFRYVQPAIYVR